MAVEPCPEFDLYATLAVTTDAPVEVILAAHRALIRMVHPDLHGESGAPEAARRLNIARDWLADPVRRATYDEWRHATPGAPSPAGPRPGSGPWERPDPGHPPGPWQPPSRDLNVRQAALERFADECAALEGEQLRRIAAGHDAAVCGHDPDLAAAADALWAACRTGGLERVARLAADDAAGRLHARHERVPSGVAAAIGWMTAALLALDVSDRDSAIVRTRWRAWTESRGVPRDTRAWWRRWLSTAPAPGTGEEV